MRRIILSFGMLLSMINMQGASSPVVEQTELCNQHEALNRAIDWGNLHHLEDLLVRGAAVNTKNSKELLPLHHSIRQGRMECLRMLIEHNAAVNSREDDGRTPLHQACDAACVQILLEHNAAMESKDTIGRTPLHVAAASVGRAASIKELVILGADVAIKDNYQLVAEDWARSDTMLQQRDV